MEKEKERGEIIVGRESNKNRPDLLKSTTERRRRTKRWVILRSSDFWGKQSKNKIVCFALCKQIFFVSFLQFANCKERIITPHTCSYIFLVMILTCVMKEHYKSGIR